VTPKATPTPTPVPTPTVTDDQLFAQMVKDVFFDYDKSDLRPDAQQAVAQAAQSSSKKAGRSRLKATATTAVPPNTIWRWVSVALTRPSRR
jgi:hypothetical protein